ncbi:6f39b13d-ecb7-41aa-b1ce-389157db0a17 [Thermothielavioides terrestris]
MNFAV